MVPGDKPLRKVLCADFGPLRTLRGSWTEKYKLDMKKVDDDVEKSAAAEKAAKDQNYEAAGKLGVVKAEYRDKDSSWNKAKATMEAKTADAEKQARAAASTAGHPFMR